MNSERVRGVHTLILVGLLLALGASGCQPLDGGAVEVSWQFRSATGDVLDCRSLGIQDVRLTATALDPAPGGPPLREYYFDCRLDVGQTDFSYPPGRYSLRIEPLCGRGVSALPDNNAVVPAPIERELFAGQLAQLNALLITHPIERACPP
jgi:hypothetical protein